MYPKIIITSIITFLIGLTFYQVAYADSYAGLKLAEKVGEYHIRVNTITNEHFNALTAFFEGKETLESMTDETTRARLSRPENPSRECSRDEDMNFSTSCLAYKLNKEYQDLVTSLQDDLNEADRDQINQTRDITSGITDIGVSSEFIGEQLEMSSELQRQTVAFYQQTLLAYPLHLQFEITIDELNEFLSNVKQINRKVSIYPSKFHNASTAQCT